MIEIGDLVYLYNGSVNCQNDNGSIFNTERKHADGLSSYGYENSSSLTININSLQSRIREVDTIHMVAYFCPLHASYFSTDYVNMQDNYVNMQDKYVNMQDNYVNMQLIYVNMQLIYVNMQDNYVNMQLIMSTCKIFMSTCNLFMCTCKIIM